MWYLIVFGLGLLAGGTAFYFALHLQLKAKLLSVKTIVADELAVASTSTQAVLSKIGQAL